MTDQLTEPVQRRSDPQPAAAGNAVTRTARAWLDLRHTPYGLLPILIIALVIVIESLDDNAFSFATPLFARKGFSINSLVELQSLVGFVTIFANLGFGFVAERTRRVPFLAIGTVFSGLMGGLTGTAKSQGRLKAFRSLDTGVGSNASNIPISALVADYYPPDVRIRVFSLLGGASEVGALIGLPIAAVGLSTLGVKNLFFLIGGALVAVGILAQVLLREPSRGGMERRQVGLVETADIEDEAMSFGESFRLVFSVRAFRQLFLADIIAGLDISDFYTILLLADVYHLSTYALAFEYGVPRFTVSVITRFFTGEKIDELLGNNARRAFGLASAVTSAGALGLVLIGLQPPLPVFVISACILAFGRSLIGPAIQGFQSRLLPARVRTLGYQIAGLAQVPGLIIATPLIQQIFYKHGYAGVYFASAPVILISAIVSYSAARTYDSDAANVLAGTAATQLWEAEKRAGSTKLLSLQGVKIAYEGVPVVFGVDIDIDEGEMVALLGTNGAGKSTVLRAMCGTQEAYAGSVLFDGRDITHMPPHEIARRGLVQMPGGKGTFPDLSVRDNLTLGGWIRNDNELARDTDELLNTFPALRRRLDDPAGVLSGGEQQMLALALAFLMKPKMLLIDELTLGLSPAAVGELVEAVRAIHASGVTVVVIEQSVALALELADRAIFMEKGQVRFDGATADLVKRPDIVRAVYLTGSASVSDRAPIQRVIEHGEPDLKINLLSKRYGGVLALDEVSFSLGKNEVLGIIGPNGSGKTTLFDVVSGLVPSDGGTVTLLGTDVTELSMDGRAREGMVRRFQDARQFSSLSVHENLLLALEGKIGVRNPILTSLGSPKARRSERRIRVRADEVIDLLELGDYRDKPTGELSTGMRRIVDLGCVIAAEPKVLLLDEPSTGIAQAEAQGLAPLLKRVQRESGCSILIIEHHMPLLRAVSDRYLALARGRVIASGNPDDVLNDPAVSDAYLGAAAPTT